MHKGEMTAVEAGLDAQAEMRMKRRVGVRTTYLTRRQGLGACWTRPSPVSSPSRFSSTFLSRLTPLCRMDSEEDWNTFLHDHPIFSLTKGVNASASGAGKDEQHALELSLNTLPDFTNTDLTNDGPAPSGRRQVMVMKDSDIIVAVGNEIRMASLGDSKSSKSQRKTYKVCMHF